MNKTPQCQSPKMIKFTPYETYSETFSDLFQMSRTDSGVVTAKWYCSEDGGSAFWDYPLHRGIGQLCAAVGQDADASVFILGGSGDNYLRLGPTSLPEDFETKKWSLYEHSYYDGCNMVEGLVNDVECPTIGIINGKTPAAHTEISLLCDITIMSEDAVIIDPHFKGGDTLPGDGIQIALRHCMGPKRANYAMLTQEVITPDKALAYGLVNEVVPADKVYDRALEIAEMIASKPRLTTRLLAQTLRMPLKEQVAKELRTTFGTEMWNMLSSNITHDEAFERMNKD